MRSHLVRLLIVALIAALVSGCGTPAPELSDQVVPDAGCRASPGEVNHVYVFTTSVAISECLAIGEHQRVSVWNKGFGSTSVGWFGWQRVASDSEFTTGPVGEKLAPGFYEVEGRPFDVPLILVVPASESPGAALSSGDEQVGGVSIGDTRDEAESILGLPLEWEADLIDPNECWTTTISGDPYSPIFYGRPGADTISLIEITYPETAAIGDTESCAR